MALKTSTKYSSRPYLLGMMFYWIDFEEVQKELGSRPLFTGNDVLL